MLILLKKCLIEIHLEILKEKKINAFCVKWWGETLDCLALFLLSPSFFPFGGKNKKRDGRAEYTKITMPSKQSLFCLIKMNKTAV